MYIMHIAVTNVFLIYCEYILQKMRSKDQKRQTLELQVRLVMLTMRQSQPIYFSRYPNPPDIVLFFFCFSLTILVMIHVSHQTCVFVNV